MKKLLKIILSLVLVFSIMPKDRTLAEDQVTNIVIDGNTVSWDPYPNASYYEINFGVQNQYTSVKETTADLYDAASRMGAAAGKEYHVYVVARSWNGNKMATGEASSTYYYPGSGTITNGRIDGDMAVWDPYPGAAYYKIQVNWFDYKTDTNSIEGIAEMFKRSGFSYGGRNIPIFAYNEKDEEIAKGYTSSSTVYWYEPKGNMDFVQNAHWVDDHIAEWDVLEGADSYILYLNGPDIEVGPIFCEEGNRYDFGPYMTASGRYSYIVRARAYEYADGPESYSTDVTVSKEGVKERISGSGRYETSQKIANAVLDAWDLEQFSAAVITTGVNYPDALSGSFLANMNKAPMLMINEKSANTVLNYVRVNVKAGGVIYVLGGTGAVKEEWVQPFRDYGYQVVRLSGNNRYKTNLEVLKEAGVKDGTVLVCTGKAFADSLSCSALPYPILLVNVNLNDDQRAFLSGLNKANTKFYIIGGKGAVNEGIENELKNYGTVAERISGSDRYETSVKIARRFTVNNGRYVIATGKNFPDGLSGGPLAYALGAPLLLIYDGKTSYAAEYTGGRTIDLGIALGGDGAISKAVMDEVFHIGENTQNNK